MHETYVLGEKRIQILAGQRLKKSLFTDTGDESSSDSVSRSMPTPPSCATTTPGDAEQRQRRSFFVRLKQRAQSRGDQPQYVLVHVVGHLRVPQPSARRPSKSLFILTCSFKFFRNCCGVNNSYDKICLLAYLYLLEFQKNNYFNI